MADFLDVSVVYNFLTLNVGPPLGLIKYKKDILMPRRTGINDGAGRARSQSTELTREPPELVQHFRLKEEFTSTQKRCMS